MKWRKMCKELAKSLCTKELENNEGKEPRKEEEEAAQNPENLGEKEKLAPLFDDGGGQCRQYRKRPTQLWTKW